MLKYISTLFIVLFLAGCAGGSSSAQNGTLPNWVLNPSSSNAMYYYSVGEGTNKNEAKNNALKQISEEISVTISSNTTTKKLATTKSYEKTIQDITKASTEKIKFTGVTVTNNAFSNGTFYSYVKVDRGVLFESQEKQMLSTYKKVLSTWNKIEKNGIFYVFKESKNLNDNIDSVLAQLPILKSINEMFDDTKYSNELLTIKEKANKLKAKAIVYIKTSNARNEKIVFEKAISDYGIKITKNPSNVKNKENLIIITIDKSAKPYTNRYKSLKMKDVIFADVKLKVVTFDSSGKTKLAQNIIEVRNGSRDSYEAAVVKTKKLEREIERKGILNLLLETI